MDFTFSNIKMHHATRAKAEKLARLLDAEYPALTLDAIANEDASAVDSWEVVYTDADGEITSIYDGAKVPELAFLLEACQDEDLDPEFRPEGDEDEEQALSGSVVKETYRARYREVSSNGQTCGDWLAERMVDDTSNGDGKLDVGALTELFEANGLDMSAKWAMARFTGSRGWQGRYRMSGRIVLEKMVALTGIYSDPNGVQVNPPADWLADVRAKHATWLAKEAKAIAAAAGAVKGSVEG